MNRTVRNTIWILVALAAIAAWVPTDARAEILEVKLQVNGLGCPFCVFGLEKHLKTVDGVEKVATHLKKGEVILHYTADASFDGKSLDEAVTRGGFTPGPMEVTALGTVVSDGDRITFRVRGSDAAFLLHDFTSDTKATVERAAEAKQLLLIAGPVHHHEDDLPGLSIKQLEERSAP